MISVGLNIVNRSGRKSRTRYPQATLAVTRTDIALTGIHALSGAIPTFCSRRDRKMSDQFDTFFDSFVISLKRTPERLRDFRTERRASLMHGLMLHRLKRAPTSADWYSLDYFPGSLPGKHDLAVRLIVLIDPRRTSVTSSRCRLRRRPQPSLPSHDFHNDA
jgi:hypothetical protein